MSGPVLRSDGIALKASAWPSADQAGSEPTPYTPSRMVDTTNSAGMTAGSDCDPPAATDGGGVCDTTRTDDEGATTGVAGVGVTRGRGPGGMSSAEPAA